MEKFKGTPGPWVESIASSAGYLTLHIQTVDTSHRNTFIGEIGGGLQSEEQIHANARLIATAPELLEALMNLIDVCEAYEHHNQWLHMAKGVRDKALDNG